SRARSRLHASAAAFSPAIKTEPEHTQAHVIPIVHNLEAAGMYLVSSHRTAVHNQSVLKPFYFGDLSKDESARYQAFANRHRVAVIVVGGAAWGIRRNPSRPELSMGKDVRDTRGNLVEEKRSDTDVVVDTYEFPGLRNDFDKQVELNHAAAREFPPHTLDL